MLKSNRTLSTHLQRIRPLSGMRLREITALRFIKSIKMISLRLIRKKNGQ